MKKASKRIPFFFGTNAPAFDAAQGSRGRISAVYPIDRRPSRALTYLSRSGKKINFSTVFAGQAVGINEVQDDIWLVSFMDYDLGHFDLETRVLEPLENPFGPKVLPM
jgi:hypothetical protein